MSRRIKLGALLPFIALHIVALVGMIWVPLSRTSMLLLILSYSVRMFGVTAGYHRYFGHKSYKLGRMAQFWMAVLAQTSAQKGALWWAAHHREHHSKSDRAGDIHSPWLDGFWWSHAGWVVSNQYDEHPPGTLAEFRRYPELRWLDRYHWVPTVAYAAVLVSLFGWAAFFWSYVVATVLLYHCTFSINSIAHMVGTRRFDTPDHSRNNWWLALITFGEGWHNNHHFSPGSCRQGWRWWELDLTYYGLRALNWLGIAHDLRPFRAVTFRDVRFEHSGQEEAG